MIRFFTDFNELKEASKELGLDVDLHALTSLDTLFAEEYKNFLVLNVRDYSENPNNLLILSAKNSLAYSQKQFAAKDYKLYKNIMGQKFGESTVLCFLVLRDVLFNYGSKLEKLLQEVDAIESAQDYEKFDSVGRSLRKLIDRLDDFVDLLIELEDRKTPQVDTQYISYDYDILRAKAQHLLDRSKNLTGRISEIRKEIEVRETFALNKRIEVLSEVVKKLTAITIIIMIPNIVAGHFGMNLNLFLQNRPDAEIIVLGISLALMASVAIYFKKKHWL